MQVHGYLVHIYRGIMRCYISLGSNLGNTEENLQKAILSIVQHNAISLIKSSSVYKTEPQGDKNQEWFANQVIIIDYNVDGEKELIAENLMQYLLGVEAGLGRIRDEARRFGPRIIDIDILYIEDLLLNTPILTVPHPRVLERAFVLIPLQEIAPNIRIAESTIQEALAKLEYRVENNKIYQ